MFEVCGKPSRRFFKGNKRNIFTAREKVWKNRRSHK
jgi:hypothetical protein